MCATSRGRSPTTLSLRRSARLTPRSAPCPLSLTHTLNTLNCLSSFSHTPSTHSTLAPCPLSHTHTRHPQLSHSTPSTLFEEDRKADAKKCAVPSLSHTHSTPSTVYPLSLTHTLNTFNCLSSLTHRHTPHPQLSRPVLSLTHTNTTPSTFTLDTLNSL